MVLKVFSFFLVALLAIWLVLFFGSTAVLVSGKGPVKKPNDLVKTISCTYFTGSSLIEKDFPYPIEASVGGILQIQVQGYYRCPKTLHIEK